MPQLVEALRRHALPGPTNTETVGAAAQNSPWIVTQVLRDSGHALGKSVRAFRVLADS
jgi:hypothetical protein